MPRDTPHQRTIDQLAASDPEIQTRGFWNDVRKLIAEIKTADIEEFGIRTFVPDAYKIDRTTKTIIVYEVESSNRLSREKLDVLVESWMDWDADEYDDWTFEVNLKDTFGTPARRLDMVKHYGEYTDRQIARDALVRLNEGDF